MRTAIALALAAIACSQPGSRTSGTGASRPGSAESGPGEIDAAPDTPTGAAARRDAELAALAIPILDAHTNTFAAFVRNRSTQIVFVSSRDGLPQLYAAEGPDAPATRILTTGERIIAPIVAPGGKHVVFLSDTGADENWSFFRVGLDGQNLVELTPGGKLNRDVFHLPDGKPSTLFFSARTHAEARSTIYATSAVEPGEPRPIYTDEGPAFLIDVSRDGRLALVLQYPSQSENHLLQLDLETGKAARVYPPEPDAKVTIHAARFSRDKRRIYVATDAGTEQSVVLALDATWGKQPAKPLGKYDLDPPTTEVSAMHVAPEGGHVAISLRAGNHGKIRLLDGRTLAVRHDLALPLGDGHATGFSDDGKRLALQWSTPTTPTDVFAADTATGAITPLRSEPRPTLAGGPAVEASITTIPAFDGGVIPTNVYLPSGSPADRRPVIVSFHGGPAGTSVVQWTPHNAIFLALGFAVVEPNVRGSAGFGRAFEAADNGPRRRDAFRDIETAARWVASQPWADPERLVVFGGSYGGYTTLVALSRWPELWRAGVDLFGVTDLRTLMANTSGLLRAVLRDEFGDDPALLVELSPITAVDQIVDPTFVYAGANDPRVPRSESDAIVKALRARKIPVEYMVAANEGHSLTRRDNRIAFYGRLARFLETHLELRDLGSGPLAKPGTSQ
jgi:dipeptidyl aminopeptidase/acylaminoacyl peptidase